MSCAPKMAPIVAECTDPLPHLSVGPGPEDLLVVYGKEGATHLQTITAKRVTGGAATLVEVPLSGGSAYPVDGALPSSAAGLTRQVRTGDILYGHEKGISKIPGDANVAHVDRVNNLWSVDRDRTVVTQSPNRSALLLNALIGRDLSSDDSSVFVCRSGEANCQTQNSQPEFANGIVGYKDGSTQTVIAGDYQTGYLHAFDLADDDTLKPICTIKIEDQLADGKPAQVALDNLISHDGQLFIAAQHSPSGVARHLFVRSLSPGPSTLYVIDEAALVAMISTARNNQSKTCAPLRAGDGPLRVVVRDDGERVKAMSSGVRIGDRVYLGQIVASDIVQFGCA